MGLPGYLPEFILEKIVFYCDRETQYLILAYDFDRFFEHTFFNYSNVRFRFVEYCLKVDNFKQLVFIGSDELSRLQKEHIGYPFSCYYYCAPMQYNLGYGVYKKQKSKDRTLIKCFCGVDMYLKNFKKHIFKKNLEGTHKMGSCSKCQFIAPKFRFHKNCKNINKCPICGMKIKDIIGNKELVRTHILSCCPTYINEKTKVVNKPNKDKSWWQKIDKSLLYILQDRFFLGLS